AEERDVEALAIDLAGDDDAGDAVQRLGDVRVGELAHVLGEDRVDDPGRLALGARGRLHARAEAGDGYRFPRGGVGTGRRIDLLGQRLADEARQRQGSEQRGTTSHAATRRALAVLIHFVSPPVRATRCDW